MTPPVTKTPRSSLRAIAAEAGVSVDTVSRVLNGRIKGMRRDALERATRIQSIADGLNYRPNSVARAMRAQRTQQVGVLIRNNPGDRYTHPLAFEMIVGINEGLEEAGYVLSIVRIGDVEKGGRSRALREHVLDGLIVIDAMTDRQQERINELSSNVVWCDSSVWLPTGCIRRDEVQAGRMAAEAAVRLGYQRIVWLGLSTEGRYLRNYSLPERLEGVRRVAAEAGVELVEAIEPDHRSADNAVRVLEELRGDTCVIAYGVSQARWVSQMAASANLSPGFGYGLISCDGSHDMYRLWPNLSRVDFDRFELGRQAAVMLMQGLEKPEQPMQSSRRADRYIPGNTAWGPIHTSV